LLLYVDESDVLKYGRTFNIWMQTDLGKNFIKQLKLAPTVQSSPDLKRIILRLTKLENKYSIINFRKFAILEIYL